LLELESSLEVVEELPELLVEDDDEVLEVLVFEEPALLVACGVEPPPPPPPPHAVMTIEQDAKRINAIFELVILFSAKKEPTQWSVLLIINFQNPPTLMQTRVILN
jgi:hypothetical protein